MQGEHDSVFIGLDNYKYLMEDEVFWEVIKNNIWYALGTVPTSIILAMMMACFVNAKIRAKSWIRTFFFYPTVIPTIAIANIWLFIYTPGYGLINHILSWFGIGSVNFLGQSETVMAAMIVMIVWKQAGYFMIFYLAGLQNIPTNLYEVAKIEGTSAWNTFKTITFPLLMPTTLFVFIISLTNAFKLVDHIIVMTQGGPNNASNLLLYYIYQVAFRFWDKGLASALTVIMLMIMVIIAVIQFFSLDRKIHYS